MRLPTGYTRYLVLCCAVLLAPWLVGCMSATAPDRAHGRVHQGDARGALVRIAIEQLGTPYRYGGNSRQGFDCSGLVEYAHRRIGLQVPRTTAEQWRNARAPDRRHLLPGDLVFFVTGDKARHVGIYEGNGRFIHAPSTGKRVSRASLDQPYWRARMIGARTFL